MDIYYPQENAHRYDLLLDGKKLEQADVLFAHIPTGLVVFIETHWKTGKRIIEDGCQISKWRVEVNGRLIELTATGWFRFIETRGRVEIVPL
jgi:hypothetical protein